MKTETPIEVLHRHGKSFYWGSFFLPAKRRTGAARLYAFCRRLDDIADELPPEEARQQLLSIAGLLRKRDGSDPGVGDFLALEREFGVSRPAALRLIDTLIDDCRPRFFEQTDALLRYAYGVAGTVGLMMCPLLGVRDPQAYPFAVDLGVAMQLTNIARDVQEDAGRGRRYLPMTSGACSPERLLIGDVEARKQAWEGVLRLLQLADAYYRRADRGMIYIPPRPRLAIAVAASLYEGIGKRILDRGEHGYWLRRAHVGVTGKISHTLTTIARLVRAGESSPLHQPQLHSAFGDLLTQDLAGSQSR